MSPFLRQPVAEDARHHVRGAASRKRHDDFHRSRRIILSPALRRRRQDGGERERNAEPAPAQTPMPSGDRAERHQRLLITASIVPPLIPAQAGIQPYIRFWALSSQTTCNAIVPCQYCLRVIPRRSWPPRPPGPRFPDFDVSTRASPAACWRADRLPALGCAPATRSAGIPA